MLICDEQAGSSGEWLAARRTGDKGSKTSQEDQLTCHGHCPFWSSIW